MRTSAKHLTQTVINRWLTGANPTDAYGDPFLWVKPESIFRLTVGNICGLKGAHWMDCSRDFFQGVVKLQSDIAGILEPNQFLPLIPKEDHLGSRFRRALPGSLTRHVYNVTEAHEAKHCWGGAALISWHQRRLHVSAPSVMTPPV